MTSSIGSNSVKYFYFESRGVAVRDLTDILIELSAKVDGSLPTKLTMAREKCIQYTCSNLDKANQIAWMNDLVSNISKVFKKTGEKLDWDATGISILLQCTDLSEAEQAKCKPLLAALPMEENAIMSVKVVEIKEEGKSEPSL